MFGRRPITMPVDPKLREQLRMLIAKRDIQRKEVASQAGIHPTTLTSLLKGHSEDVMLSTLEKIAKVLDCDLEILITEKQREH